MAAPKADAGKKKPEPPKRRRGGAPSKRTDKRRAAILKAVAIGASLHVAAKAAGIHYDTLNEWRKADPEFSDALEKARAQMEVTLLKRVTDSAKTTWQAAAWKLERFFPDRYSRRMLLTGAGGGPVEIKGELKIAGEIRGNEDATAKIHDAIAAAAGAKTS